MASTISSSGITDLIPAIASSDEVIAWIAKNGFRFTQGISTKPQTGSQVKPKIFYNASATALKIWSVVPPRICVTAADAIAAATPHSA